MASRPRVALVILNFNGGDLNRRSVLSCCTIRYPDLRILLVDNGSSDGSEQFAEQIDGVDLIRTGANLGYTGGNNVGIQRGIDLGADYVLVVNNDVEVVNPDFLDQLVAFLEEHPRVAIAGPKVWFRERGRIQNTLCGLPSFWRMLLHWPLQKIGWHRGTKSGDVVVEPEVLNGVCILLRSEFLLQQGLMDPKIFMYRDDTDLALRAREGGWKLAYVPVESIVHLQKADGYDYCSMVNFLLKRNAVYVMRKHGYLCDALLHLVSAVCLSVLRAVRATVLGRSPGRHWRFVRVLARGSFAALRGTVEAPCYGPPECSWKSLMEARQ